MGNTKHRKKHKQKLAARKLKLVAQKNQYKKAVNAQIEMIKEQMKMQQAEKLDVSKDFNMTDVENLPNIIESDRGINIVDVQDAEIITEPENE